MNKYLKGRRLIGIIAAVVVLFFAYPLFFDFLNSFKPSDKWAISSEGLVMYPENRGSVEYTLTVLNDTAELTISKIVYNSKGENVYTLLRAPKTQGKKPAIILLPGAQVTKEGMRDRAEKFSEWGYVTITLDERGNTGETKGGIISMDDEYLAFISGKEPTTHKMVFDVLRAFDFLREQDYVDSKNIAVYGESMGGRFAIIAGAMEPRIKAVIGVSTAGYDSLSRQFPNENVLRFFRSINPDAYAAKIAPRTLLMIHSTNDTIIPIDMGRKTFENAREPKEFITVDYPTHGWHPDMAPVLKGKLEDFFSK